MDVVLDLDLDFFVWPVCNEERVSPRLPVGECKYLATEQEVRQFLEQRCHLSRESPLMGQDFVEHEKAFHIWRDWLRTRKLTTPFVVIHVDAHSDLGAGWCNPTLTNLRKLLRLPVSERSELGLDSGIDSGNYLTFAIANQWISRLTCVYPTETNPILPERRSRQDSGFHRFEDTMRALNVASYEGENEPPRDVPAWCFRNNDYRTKLIEFHEVDTEPAVPFERTLADNFDFTGFTHMVIAESPQYTPEAVKHLLAVVREYFETYGA